MLFNSYIFLFAFLPVTLLGFHLLRRANHQAGQIFLVMASLFFYSWWNPAYISLILLSCAANFTIGRLICQSSAKQSKTLLALGISANLVLLGYYKYANFFVDSLNTLLTTDYNLQQILLPLAISFFTFQQIAYLVDTYRGETAEYSFLHYLLFVSFFPQLIAGPIVHHREVLPQFQPSFKPDRATLAALGISIFIIGLFKKVVLADGISHYVSPIFNAAEQGVSISFFEAWGGALSYTFQLYYDFSGYSDMAIGLGLMFGISLPLNFFSPYKASNIIEFWRRWHITLSRFLRDYLYIPLGGSRKGRTRRYLNLMITMLLGGLWHGAAWTFVAWGLLHGIYLSINHGWQQWVTPRLNRPLQLIWRPCAYLLTFVGIVVGWVLFRAESFAAATNILAGMAGLQGVVLHPDSESLIRVLNAFCSQLEVSAYATRFVEQDTLHWLLVLAAIAWLLPNTAQLVNYRTERAPKRLNLHWRPSLKWALVLSILALTAVSQLSRVSEFLYFQF